MRLALVELLIRRSGQAVRLCSRTSGHSVTQARPFIAGPGASRPPRCHRCYQKLCHVEVGQSMTVHLRGASLGNDGRIQLFGRRSLRP
jgi:hypothetical protein